MTKTFVKEKIGVMSDKGAKFGLVVHFFLRKKLITLGGIFAIIVFGLIGFTCTFTKKLVKGN